MGMTKQDLDNVMQGVEKLLEDVITPVTGALVERIATLENRLKTDDGNNPPPSEPVATDTPSDTTNYHY